MRRKCCETNKDSFGIKIQQYNDKWDHFWLRSKFPWQMWLWRPIVHWTQLHWGLLLYQTYQWLNLIWWMCYKMPWSKQWNSGKNYCISFFTYFQCVKNSIFNLNKISLGSVSKTAQMLVLKREFMSPVS